MTRQETIDAVGLAMARVDTLFHRAALDGLSSEEVLEGLVNILSRMASGKLSPPWGRAYVCGYAHAFRARFHAEHLYHAKQDPDGRLWEDQGRYGCNNLTPLYGGPDRSWQSWRGLIMWQPHPDYPERTGKAWWSDDMPGWNPMDLVHADIQPAPRRK